MNEKERLDGFVKVLLDAIWNPMDFLNTVCSHEHDVLVHESLETSTWFACVLKPYLFSWGPS